MADKNILILGIGNILLGDEGFGVHAVDYLKNHYAWPDNVNLVDGGTRGLMLMSELLECDLAIVLDIALLGEDPGTFYQLEEEALKDSASPGQSLHQTSLADILASCELVGHRPETMIFCMQPYEFNIPRPQLTADAQDRLPDFCAKVVAALRARGLAINEK